MGSDLAERNSSLPTPERTDQLYRRANLLMAGMNNLKRREYREEHQEEFRAIVAELEALSRPATKVEIATKLAVLLHGFPNGGKDREAFVRILAEDVGASQPSIGVLDLACRTLRRNAEPFSLPTINAVLKALARAANQRQGVFSVLGDKHNLLECSAVEMFDPDDQIDGRL